MTNDEPESPVKVACLKIIDDEPDFQLLWVLC